MTDSEKIESIINGLQSFGENITLLKRQIAALESNVKSELQDVKNELQDVKNEIKDIKSEMQDVKSEIKDMKSEMQDVKQDMRLIKLLLLQAEGEKERTLVRINAVENEVDSLKEGLARAAVV